MLTRDRFDDVRDYVKQFDETLEPLRLGEPIPTSEDAARVIGVEVGQIAKSILFRCEDKFGLFVAAGDVRVPNKLVKALLDGKKPKIATPEEVESVTGFRVGAVCPFALVQDIPVFLDESLRRFDKVYTAAGIIESLLPITFEQLQEITNATLFDATPAEENGN